MLPERLYDAISDEQPGIVHDLIAEGADVNVGNRHGLTPLRRAVQRNNLEILGLLLDAGADVNSADKDGYTALMEAADFMAADSLRTLLDRSANINAISRDGMTALVYGVFVLCENHELPAPGDVVSVLLGRGADLSMRYRGEDSP